MFSWDNRQSQGPRLPQVTPWIRLNLSWRPEQKGEKRRRGGEARTKGGEEEERGGGQNKRGRRGGEGGGGQNKRET